MPKGTAKYPFSGVCTSPERPGAQIQYRLEGSWSPSEADPNKPNASESVTMTGFERFTSIRAPGGSIFMYWTARCKTDPWLQPESANCRLIGTHIPDDLRQAVPDLLTLNFPKTENMIAPADRERLQAQYLGLNLKSKPPTAIGAPRPGIAPMILASPELVSPMAGRRIPQGDILVKIRRSLGGGAEVEFSWLDKPPMHAPYVATWRVSMDQLAAGAVAPAQMTDKAGRWEVRVRTSRANPGPWSQPVRFLVTPQPSPVPQQKLPPMIEQNPSPFMQEGSQRASRCDPTAARPGCGSESPAFAASSDPRCHHEATRSRRSARSPAVPAGSHYASRGGRTSPTFQGTEGRVERGIPSGRNEIGERIGFEYLFSYRTPSRSRPTIPSTWRDMRVWAILFSCHGRSNRSNYL